MKEDEIIYYIYLEQLRRSGVTNMFGAGAYLQRDYKISSTESNKILSNWMQHYDEIEKYLEDNNYITKRND